MSRIRNAARLVRRLPVVRRTIEASDPARRASRLAASGLIDTTLYAAQLRVDSISTDEAAQHYVRYGHLAGLTVNALIDPFVVRRRLGDTGRPPIYDYLVSRVWETEVSSVWSTVDYLAAHPDAAQHPAGPVGHLWDRVRLDPETPLLIRPGGERELPWSDIGHELFSGTADWAEQLEDERARHSRRVLQHAEHLPPSPLPDSGPTVSIVMPVRNRAAGLRRAVESVLEQEWPWWELLIVDDGSWDDTPAVAALLAERDSRIRFEARPHSGVCATRNAGIAAATGEFMAFLDSDNTWDRRFLHEMISTMDRDSIDSAYATVKLIQHPDPEEDADLDTETMVRYRHGAPELRNLLQGNSIDLNVLVTRTEIVRSVGGFDPTLRRAVDYDLILKLAEHSDIVHVPIVGATYDNLESADDRISTTEPVGWNAVVRLRHLQAPSPIDRDGATVIAVIQKNDAHLPEKLAQLSALPADFDCFVAAVGVDPDEWRAIRASNVGRPGFSAELFHSSEPFAYVVDSAVRSVRRTAIVVTDPRSRFRTEHVRVLADDALTGDATAVMPVTTAPDGSVEAAGAAFVTPRRVPGRLFAGQPVEDVRASGTSVAVPALAGRTFAVRTDVFRAAGGLDPLLYNQFEAEALSLRLARLEPPVPARVRTDVVLHQAGARTAFRRFDLRSNLGVIRSATSDRAQDDLTALYGAADQVVEGWHLRNGVGLQAVVRRVRRTVNLPDGREVPRLRWAIRTAAPAGPVGETWGDTHFAQSLADGLRSLGQEAVVLSREVDGRASRDLDDVEIVLRGLDRVHPDPGVLSMLWIISHPDLVTRAEAAEFDRVFAASISWSEKMTDRWALPIAPLLQCTDAERFTPTGAPRGDDVLFVGNSRGIPRPTVMETVRSDVKLSLYGGEWERFVPAGSIIAERVGNADLARLYESASIVLNDHWADMRREGFMSNRLFDVVAAGGRVMSDEVYGAEEIFGGAVQQFHAISELRPLLESDHAQLFPTEPELQRISARVRDEHSFTARARVLLDRALENDDWE